MALLGAFECRSVMALLDHFGCLIDNLISQNGHRDPASGSTNFERTPIEDGTDREPRVAHEQL